MKSEHLKKFVVNPDGDSVREAPRSRGNTLPPPLGVIEVIHIASMGTIVSQRKGVLSVVSVENAREDARLGKKAKCSRELITFGDDDLEGTTQLHDNALMVTI